MFEHLGKVAAFGAAVIAIFGTFGGVLFWVFHLEQRVTNLETALHTLNKSYAGKWVMTE